MVHDEVRLSEHVTLLRGRDGGVYPHGNPLRVTGGSTTVQLDSSLDHPARDVDLVVLSHYHEDHVVGLGEIDAPVMVHGRDLPAVASWAEFCRYTTLPPGAAADGLRAEYRMAERADATSFDDDAVIEVGGGVRIRVVPLPGHTGGHCGFYVEPDGVFYLADVDLMAFGPMYADLGSRLGDVRASLARCAELDAAVYTTFHHKGPYTDRAEYLAQLAKHAGVLDARTERILALRAEGFETAEQMLGRGAIYLAGGRRPWFADAVEAAMIDHHLADLG